MEYKQTSEAGGVYVLSNSSPAPSPTPTFLNVGGENVVSIVGAGARGKSYFIALSQTGRVYHWGSLSFIKQSTLLVPQLIQLHGEDKALQISCCGLASAAVTRMF